MPPDSRPLTLPGIPEALRSDIEERVGEFERLHEADVLTDGRGWVPRVRRVDYAVAVGVNLLIVLWLVVALAGG